MLRFKEDLKLSTSRQFPEGNLHTQIKINSIKNFEVIHLKTKITLHIKHCINEQTIIHVFKCSELNKIFVMI